MINLKHLLVEALCKTELFEMAYNRSKYQDSVIDLTNQIVENWCLIRYCSLYDKNNLNKNHWKTELRAYILKLNSMLVKVDKKRATQEVLIKWEGLDIYTNVLRKISYKWQNEKLDIESENTKNITLDFSTYGVFDIISLICSKNLMLYSINEYLDNI